MFLACGDFSCGSRHALALDATRQGSVPCVSNVFAATYVRTFYACPHATSHSFSDFVPHIGSHYRSKSPIGRVFTAIVVRSRRKHESTRNSPIECLSHRLVQKKLVSGRRFGNNIRSPGAVRKYARQSLDEQYKLVQRLIGVLVVWCYLSTLLTKAAKTVATERERRQ